MLTKKLNHLRRFEVCQEMVEMQMYIAMSFNHSAQ